MKHLRWWYILGFLVIILIVGGIAVTQYATASSPNAPRPYSPPDLSTAVNRTYTPGVSAIPVHTTAGANTNYTNTSLTPAFTKSDVAAYLNKYNKGFSGPLVSGARLKILTVQFITAKQASMLMAGQSVGRPDTYLVCYVKVQGPFQTTSIHRPPPRPGTKAVATVETNYAVFDGHTGNLLLWGTDMQ